MPTTLASALDDLYRVFADAPRPTGIDCCSCCFTAEQAQTLLSHKEVRRIPVEVIEPYAADVLITIGALNDFRHYLPRLLEIACTVGFDWPDTESLLGRLPRAGWTDWSAADQQAVRRVLRAWWETTLATYPGQVPAADVLCAIGNAEDDIEPYLRTWMVALSQPTAAAHLRDLLRFEARLTVDGWKLTNPWWSDCAVPPPNPWLGGVELRREVAAALAVSTDETRSTLTEIGELLGPPIAIES